MLLSTFIEMFVNFFFHHFYLFISNLTFKDLELTLGILKMVRAHKITNNK